MAKKSKPMKWDNVTFKLSELDPWDDNPKSISESHAKRLLDLWERFGQFQTVAIGPNGEVYDGHQRLTVLMAAYGKDYEIQALQSPRELTNKERQEITVASHVGTTGDWDWDQLEQWDADDLEAWGLDYDALKSWNTDTERLRNIFGEDIDVDELWDDMPEFEQEDTEQAFHTVKVHFDTEADLLRFAKLLKQTVTDSSKFIWYPEKPEIVQTKYRVVEDDGGEHETAPE